MGRTSGRAVSRRRRAEIARPTGKHFGYESSQYAQMKRSGAEYKQEGSVDGVRVQATRTVPL